MKALLIIFILLVQSAFAQNKIRPVVEIGYGKSFIETLYLANILQVGAGIKLNEHLYFQMMFSQIKNIRKSNNPDNHSDYYKKNVLSFSTSYRVLKDTYRISPTVTLDFGGEVYSNARGKIINYGYIIYDKYSGEPQRLYNKGKFFGKIKLQADIKLWDFNLLIGGGYTYFRIDVNYLIPIYIGYDLVGYSTGYNAILYGDGFSLDASLRYTLNFGKKDKVEY